ncbi:DUF4440 domain-containing protein [Bernardetia sp. Wsw4-3y2]|uniref:YybH family protein n=1 Tax=Bernardetia sp. Wsw4-3y2 TaxID=3127471 RepID=UPI0030CFC42B
MKTNTLVSFFILLLFSISICKAQSTYKNEPSLENQYGTPNADAPKEILDYADLIGKCNCKSVSRINQTEWSDTVAMTWEFKYIMNGMAIQDQTLKADGKHSGSIRQFNSDSSRWYVHYYSSSVAIPIMSVWEGNKNEQGDIVLYKNQPSPTGAAGFYKIVFSNISKESFDWTGAWVSKDESIIYPTWKIFCKKQVQLTAHQEKEIILKNIDAFSKAYMNADFEAIANSYSIDAKIFPSGSDIIDGREAIKEKWIIKDGSKILNHKITPLEIKLVGDYAYDFGYYEGESESKEGEKSSFKGKYVIVWKKTEGKWKMYLDIWNRI